MEVTDTESGFGRRPPSPRRRGGAAVIFPLASLFSTPPPRPGLTSPTFALARPSRIEGVDPSPFGGQNNGQDGGTHETRRAEGGEGKSYWVVGHLNTVLASGEDTGGAHALLHAVVPPGGGPSLHVHRREDEAFYVLEGEVGFHADGRDIAATAGA